MKSLYVVDASGYLYRSYHAIQNLTNSKGESTNALYGFIRSLMKLRKDFEPKHLVAVFDGPKSIEKRKEIYPAYKAQRVEMPQDLRYQIQWAQDYCDLLGIPKLVLPGVEADDAIGAVAKWAEKDGAEVYLCSGDKDLCQLVDDKVFILNTHKDNLILDKNGVEESFGVPPQKITDYLAITGDSSDNVPGLPGFGPKTAAALLKDFDSLEDILENPDQIPGKKKQETVREEAEKARISKKLVTLDTDVDTPKEPAFFQIKGPEDKEKVREFYTYMNFSTLLREFEEESGPPINKEDEAVSYKLVDTKEDLDKLVSYLLSQEEVCFDTETTHWKPMEAELVGVGFCAENKKAWYVPVNGTLGLEIVVAALKKLFHNTKTRFFGHNVKYDWHVLKNYGIQANNLGFDTIIASYLLNSHSRQHSLDSLCLEYFGKVKIALTDLIGKGKNAVTMREVPLEQACQYCCEDVDYTWRLKQLLASELEARKLANLFYKLELPLVTVLAKMERSGIFIDAPLLEEMGKEIKKSIEELEEEIFQLAGEPFNVKSPKQLSEILFEKMGITPPRKTATGYSTNAEVLETLKAEHPIAEKIIAFRVIEKLRSTYIETLPKEINPKTGRVHPTFNQSVAATGRLSCQDPNLQNIPVRTEIGRRIREAFRPEKEGWSYLSADYSQVELRLLAHFSEDPSLIKAFQNDEDIHAYTASEIFGVPLEKVSKEQRYQAKTVNFGIIYGQQAFGLARELNIGVDEASAFIKMYFEKYPRVRDFLESSKEKARKTGKAVTLLGRERLIPEINSKNKMIRSGAERLAINTPLQGTSADLIKKAMLNIDKRIEKEQKLCEMVLQIHDALIFELPDFELVELEPVVKKEMEEVHQLRVPLVVDIAIGKNWKEC